MTKTIPSEIKAFKHIIKPGYNRPILNNLYITDKVIVATDSFIIFELNRTTEKSDDEFIGMEGVDFVEDIQEPLLIDWGQLRKHVRFPKVSKCSQTDRVALVKSQKDGYVGFIGWHSGVVEHIELSTDKSAVYPNYETVFWDAKEAVSNVRVDLYKLREMVNAMIDAGEKNVFMQIKSNLGAMQFQGENSRGVVMPLRY